MHRCLELASLGAGNVAPNPMVGAVLVHDDRIIGEGYHEKFGAPHAEPNCISSVREQDRDLIAKSVLYVSLEPCVHLGKTPPCTDLIIRNKIPKVVVGCHDPFKEVDGKGIGKLRAAGVEVEVNVLEQECKNLNKRFFTFHTEHRPYIILKWAQTANGKIAGQGSNRLHITNDFTNRLVHKWRSEEAAILVGTNTALADNPQLTTRLWAGNNPVRVVIDLDLRLPSSLEVFNDKARTIVFNKVKHEDRAHISFYQVTDDVNVIHQVSNALYQSNIQSVLVEGGAKILQSFIDDATWDEARVITNRHPDSHREVIGNGLPAPVLVNVEKITEQNLFSDTIEFYKPRRATNSSE
jgi:diaminohydroxyphosphoribosylaminopyrimidine deaminase/5-amino-6-(5-phosphoribosylamino)uracil reductase